MSSQNQNLQNKENELQSTTEFLPMEYNLTKILDKKVNFFIEIQELNELISFAKSKRKVFWLNYGSAARQTDRDFKRRIKEWEERIKTVKRYGILFNNL